MNKITEWEGFCNPDINESYTEVFEAAGYERPEDMGQELVNQIKRILAYRQKIGGWSKLVNELASGLDSADKKQIIDMLEARTILLAKKAKEMS